jgi:REP element-mobilizing transposase RayT
MSDTYNNIYRIESSRRPGWDYTWQGAYFITICTAEGEHYFGHIRNKRMILSDIGRIASEEWLKTPAMRPDMNITLGSYCIMPNHVHGIIIIGENEYNRIRQNKTTGFGPQRKNLSSIVRGFKSAVTTYARKNEIAFKWQARFHDHIIRDDQSYFSIQEYIENNVRNWHYDEFNRNAG